MNRPIVDQLINQLMDKCGDDLYIECNFYYLSRALKAQLEGTYMEEGLDTCLEAYRRGHSGYRILMVNHLINKLDGGWIL